MATHSRAQEFLSRHRGLILDQSALPLLEKALSGDFESLVEASDNFMNGEHGYPNHFEASLELASRIHEINLETKDPVVILESLSNITGICGEAGAWPQAQKWQLETIKHMVENFSPEEWEFTHFDNMAAIINAQN